MSGHRRRVTIAPQAEQDIVEIQAYTLANWGEERAVAYETELFATIDLLIDNPKLGEERPDLGRSVRSLSVRHHRVLYRESAQTIRVLRVLHHRRVVAKDSTSRRDTE